VNHDVFFPCAAVSISSSVMTYMVSMVWKDEVVSRSESSREGVEVVAVSGEDLFNVERDSAF
jgi:hypothetical protein